MRAFVDRELCTGCGLCADTCFEVFEIGEDGLSLVRLTPIPPENLDCVRETVEICPVAAISIGD